MNNSLDKEKQIRDNYCFADTPVAPLGLVFVSMIPFYTPIAPLGLVFVSMIPFYTPIAPLGLVFVSMIPFYTPIAPLGCQKEIVQTTLFLSNKCGNPYCL